LKRRSAETILKARRRHFAVLALASAFVSVPAAFSQVQTLNESFEGTTAPGWVLGGSNYTPILTAAQGIDPSGSGWLRLTSNATNESTYAYDSTSFASANATITAQFNLAVYNGSGADGVTFFLADASVPFSAGAYGGSLGYAQKTAAGGGGADINGMAGGYLGIGVDEFGNYSNPNEGRIGGPGFVQNAIAVRGPGSGLSGYNYLGGTGTLSTPLSYPGQTTRPTGSQAETIQMVLTSTNQLTVSIEFGNSGVFNTVFTADLSGYTRPNDLIMGFTGSTGSSTDIHEIQNVMLSSVSANLWTNNSGDSVWNTANDWAGAPAQVPSVGSDVLLNNAYVNSAQTINVASNQIIRSLQIDAPFTYTLNNGSLEFNNEGITGTSGIMVTQSNGHADQTINSNLKADNAIVVQNNTTSNLNLTGTLATGGNTVNFNGSGVVNESGVVSGTGSVFETGTGTTNLSAANTYSGGTAITSGTLNANSNTALGTGTVTLGGGTLGSTNSSSISNALSLQGNAALSGITSNGALTQAGGSYTLNMLNSTQSGAVALSNTSTARTLTAEVDSGTSAINGIISNGGTGAGGLTMTGSGTLILGGVNTYTGATTVNGGTLQLGTNNAINSASSLTLNGSTLYLAGYSDKVGNLSFNNATIDFGTGTVTNTFVFGNVTSGTGVLTINDWKNGSTILAATSAGIAAGILSEIYFSGQGSGSVEAGSTSSVGNGEGVAYVITPNTSFLTWDGKAGGNNWSSGTNWVGNTAPVTNGGSTQKLDFTGSTRLTPAMTSNYSVNALKFDSGAGAFTIGEGTHTLTLSGSVPSIIQQSASNQAISNGTIAVSANSVVDVSGAGNLTIGSVLTGTGTLTKLSGGTLILSGINSGYSGAITAQAGTISVSTSNSVLGTGATTIDSGATLQITDGRTLTNALTVAGTGVGGVGAIYATPGTGNTATLSHSIALTGDTTIGSGSGTLVLSGGITGTGDDLTLSGAGNTTISSAIATGTAGVTLNGSGTTTFSGANTYTGATTVNSGILNLSTTAVKGDLTINGGTVNDNASSQLAATTNLSINSGTFNLAGHTESISTLTGIPGGTLALGAGTLTESGTGSMSFGGAITGSGTLAQGSTGKLILSGTSAGFTGNVTLNNGVIDATATNATGTATVAVANSGNFEVQGGISLASNFNLSTSGASTGNGAVENIAGNNSITGTVTVSANSRIQSDAGTLTVSGAVGLGGNTLNVGGNANTTLNGAVTGTSASAITKDGTGTLAIGVANPSFAGSVTVSGGTLLENVANTFKNTTAITVNTGAIMDLNSTTQVIGSLTDSGSLLFGTGGSLTLSSGNSLLSGTLGGSGTLILGAGSTLTLGANFNDANLNITLAGGTLKLNGTTDTFGSLNVTAGSVIDFANPSTSVLTVNGVTLSGGVQLSVNNWANMVDYFYSNTSPGTQGSPPINQIVFNGGSGNYTHWNTYQDGPGPGNEITPAPEPATYGAIFVGLSLAGILVYRRKRSIG
jgi:autotransporter-associated beta strand protein